MRLLDSNLLIYATQEQFAFLRLLIQDSESCVSAVSKIETLGYHKLKDDERLFFEDIFRAVTVLPISDEIVDKATELRQERKISLGDCLIAATALVNQCELYTHNIDDFTHISGLTVINPLP